MLHPKWRPTTLHPAAVPGYSVVERLMSMLEKDRTATIPVALLYGAAGTLPAASAWLPFEA